MNITFEQALKIAQHQREIGCCSATGQTIVLLLSEVERLQSTLERLKFNPGSKDNAKLGFVI